MAQQLDYTGRNKDSLGRGIHGDIATTRPYTKRARVYAKLRHTLRIAVGGATAGDHTVRISTPQGQLPVNPVEVTVSGGSADALTTALADAVNANADLRNVLRATGDTGNDRVDFVAPRSGEVFTIELVANPGSDFTLTTLLNADQSRLPLGLAMVDVDGEEARLPTTGDAARNVLGILARGKQVGAHRDGSPEGHTPGAVLEVFEDVDVYLLDTLETDLAVGDQIYVRTVAAGSEQAGALRNDADGGDAVLMASWRVLQAGGPSSGQPALISIRP